MQDAPARRSHSDETPGSTMDIDEAPPAAGGGTMAPTSTGSTVPSSMPSTTGKSYASGNTGTTESARHCSEDRSSTESASASELPSNMTAPKLGSAGGNLPKGSSLPMYFGVAESNGRRNYMQDRHLLIEDFQPSKEADLKERCPEVRSLLGVFDGHKRSEPAETAARRLPELLSREKAIFGPAKQTSSDEVFAAIKRTFQTLDDEILKEATSCDIADCQFGGSTAVIALRIGHVMYIAHCGDSGAVMACTSYDLHFPLRLTTDHKPNRADEHARIQAANGNIDEKHNRVVSEPKPHNGRVTLLSMSRCLGDPQFKENDKDVVDCTPEMRRVELQPGDFAIVLASDGLWDVLSDTEVVTILQKVRDQQEAIDGKTPKLGAEALVQQSLRKGTADNVTAVVLMINWPES
ncbi:g37 [Coccomyxa viridis]|uniref:G37 protein n=1 Tax=Coccomyxa viridis TaxID=1274662 RepID=A0ABP1FGR4_9CHLO